MNRSIDILRLFAAIMVILIHITAPFIVTGMENSELNITFKISNFINSFSRISVPIFILISGRFLLSKNYSFRNGVFTKIKKIFTILIFWGLLYIFYKTLGNYFLNNKFELKENLLSIFYGRPFYHLWYLYMLLGLYLLQPFLSFIIKKSTKKNLWLTSIILIIMASIITIIETIKGNEILFIFWCIKYIGVFLLGYLLIDIKSIHPKYLILIYIVSSFITSIFSYYTALKYKSLFFYNFTSPLIILGAVSIYILFTQSRKYNRFLLRVSGFPLGIYLIHAIILDIISKSLSLLNFVPILDNILIDIFIKLIVTFFLSYYFSFKISKIKYLKKII